MALVGIATGLRVLHLSTQRVFGRGADGGVLKYDGGAPQSKDVLGAKSLTARRALPGWK